MNEHTHMIANATSVTRNRRSTSQSAIPLPTTAAIHPSRHIPGRMRRSSARKVNAHRNPHHAAGTTLKARQTIRGIYHLRSTPRMTATRGWRDGRWCDGDEAAESLDRPPILAVVVDSWRCWAASRSGMEGEREEGGESGTMVKVGEEDESSSNSSMGL